MAKNQAAIIAFRKAALDAKGTMEAIAAKLQDMNAVDDANINWGNVGSIGFVNGLLNEIESFLTAPKARK